MQLFLLLDNVDHAFYYIQEIKETITKLLFYNKSIMIGNSIAENTEIIDNIENIEAKSKIYIKKPSGFHKLGNTYCLSFHGEIYFSIGPD